MATRSDATLIPANDTDAHFRNWAGFIELLIVTTGGWVVTGDTGQTAPASLAHPTVANTKQGYRIYRMADALQATSPVYMRMDFGSGGGANDPAVWITIGTGSDGAGTITTIRFATTQFKSNTNSTTQVTNSYGSADTGRFVFAMFDFTSNVGYLQLGVERTKDSNGLDTGDGLYILATKNNGLIGYSQVVNLLGISQPPLESGWSYVLAGQNPSTFSTNTGIALPIPFSGNALQPGLNWAVVRAGDFVAGATFVVTVYGVAHTYQCLTNALNASIPVGTTVQTDSQSRIAVRFD